MTRFWPAGVLVVLVLCTGGDSAAWAQGHAVSLPLPAGAVVVQTLSFTGGDRESLMSLAEVTEKGSRWTRAA
ncbi:MAG TPA: hypothetical protein VMN37_05270 [Gemmatimonadales bacterium]|nr:hypothetical protein [Gemmatimonadales bacterium]